MKKIVCVVNDQIDYMSLEIYCFEYTFLKSKICNKFYYEINDDNLLDVKNEINNKLNEIEFSKASCNIGIYSFGFFSETMNMPKLNFIEESKSKNLKLDKLYKNFNDNFISVHDKSTYNKTTRRHMISGIRKKLYSDIVEKINLIFSNIDKILFLPMSLAYFIGRKHIFSTDKLGLFLNIEKHTASIIVLKGPHLIDYKILNNKINTPTVNYSSEDDDQNNNLITHNLPFNIIREIKRLSYIPNLSITEFYYNTECDVDCDIKKQLETELNITFKSNIKLLSYQLSEVRAFSLLRSPIPSFPVKIK